METNPKKSVFPLFLFFFALLAAATAVGGSIYSFMLVPAPTVPAAPESKVEALPAQANTDNPSNDMRSDAILSRIEAEARRQDILAIRPLLAVRLAQLTIGMVTGIFLISLGAYLTWIGVKSNLQVGVERKETKATLLTA